MTTERKPGLESSQEHEHLADDYSEGLLPRTISQLAGADHPARTKQKAVKNRSVSSSSTAVGAVYAKEFAMHKRSILTNKTPHIPGSGMRAKTLLEQPLPTEENLKSWRNTDEYTKLVAAAIPLHWMAKTKGWELKSFTLILNKKLSDRIDGGDVSAQIYIRDQLTRLMPDAVGDGTEFLYGLEKTPIALADHSSRGRWHLHGLIIGPVGFSAPGKTPLRKALRSIKGEADADLMFQTPGAKIERDLKPSAMSWCFYTVKNGLSVQENPVLASAYDLPPRKQTYISARLRREAERWYRGISTGITIPDLIQSAHADFYTSAV